MRGEGERETEKERERESAHASTRERVREKALVNSLHSTTHLGEKALQRLLERSFRGTGFQTTIRQVVSSCPTCQLNRPSPSNDVGPTQERTGRWTSPRCQFLKGINTY